LPEADTAARHARESGHPVYVFQSCSYEHYFGATSSLVFFGIQFVVDLLLTQEYKNKPLVSRSNSATACNRINKSNKNTAPRR
jgi:hypothetical protein